MTNRLLERFYALCEHVRTTPNAEQRERLVLMFAYDEFHAAEQAMQVRLTSSMDAPKNAQLDSLETAQKAFAGVKPLHDEGSSHVTSVDGNLFEDLGYPGEEAARLLEDASARVLVDLDVGLAEAIRSMTKEELHALQEQAEASGIADQLRAMVDSAKRQWGKTM